MMCGFTDIRKQSDGTYQCGVCLASFDKGWLARIDRVNRGSKDWEKLKAERLKNERAADYSHHRTVSSCSG